MEAAEIFLRLLRGDVITPDMIRPTVLTRANFRSDEDWQAVQDAAVEFEALEQPPEEILIPQGTCLKTSKPSRPRSVGPCSSWSRHARPSSQPSSTPSSP